jgi:hypothetical protein
MPEQPRLDVLELEGCFKQRVVLQVDLADGEIICRTPIGVHLAKEFGR